MSENLIKMLQTAAKGKAPIVAIPVEGHAPVCLNRKRLAAWTKGVDIHSVEVITPDVETITFRDPGEDSGNVGCYEGPRERIVTTSKGVHRSIKIAGRCGNVKTTCTMFVVSRQAAALEIWKWAEKERKSNLKVIAQGATGAAAIKAAQKEVKRKERAAKLLQMEKGGSKELEDAQIEVENIFYAARRHGRGQERGLSVWEQKDKEEKQAELVIRHVSHHNTPHRIRKQAAVIRWRLKALKAEWYEVTKVNPNRRKTTTNKFLKVKKSIRVIQIVKDTNVLMAELLSILPARLPNPRWANDEEYVHVFTIDPLNRPMPQKESYWWHDSYSREALAIRLRVARETIRVLTPPPDDILEMPDHPAELTRAA